MISREKLLSDTNSFQTQNPADYQQFGWCYQHISSCEFGEVVLQQ
ncbi:Uncharacterised protein [Porphyromonas crevioricanis]|uniref:Uncharacterized protein n=1 Tax=Porphyromonas crevioricanis TaxID=393921 RepID=A0A2X4PKJ1_9PORP|nr:hypothetical protein PORCAN_626 [Porphyromonas crevioricanis JCM 13913]SQH72835.1 Uncharacterised protein [Porphyromonas crevioricanis]